jgi:N-acetylglutamate synthase-like GNAT family acetyltransferase
MEYQLQVLSQDLEKVQVQARALLQAVPQERVQSRLRVEILLRALEAVQRQAQAVEVFLLEEEEFLQQRGQELARRRAQAAEQARAVELVAQELELAEVPPQVGLEVLQVQVQELE